ncbi:MAG TPA: methyl-accepting chemotaxis protein [Deltaproteobacteria bacterium]|nr:methyl-accepting chemotaxis protein [Deltaproteobacteria bacterium]HPJ92319.1 methyl-accepting chemotaxis protein [Deltaproteobacteria bacterium]HPR50882.1 methyl-accepting chemotaxis protein [Deltaproteobacteria bacterium]
MKFQLKLRGRLTALALVAGLVPLFIAIIYVGHRSGVLLENQAQEYLKAKVDGFASMVEVRFNSIEGNLDIIKEQLRKNLKDELVKQAAKERYFGSGSLMIFDAHGICIYHPKPEYKNNSTLYERSEDIRTAISQKQGVFRYSDGGNEKIAYLRYIDNPGWILWGEAPADEILSNVTILKAKMWVFFFVISLFVAIGSTLFASKIAKRARDISSRMMDIAQGEADLSVRLPVLSKDEVGEIAHWFNEFVANLEDVITKVKNTALHVDDATQGVAARAQGLSQATQQQASFIEEVAATIEEMTSSIKQNASNASQGREKAQAMVQVANTSSEASKELMMGMGDISNASKKIGDIIVTVNEVSFQTNLLALNAAVEAARAGEHGKGFAVVAEEVRALAQRSSDAARQIKDLIEDTVTKIGAGDAMVKRSGESLKEIISHIENLSLTMDEIAAASSEQACGVDDLNRAVSQIDSTTQQNASTVEELASTSDNLSNEAKYLAETVERFKVSNSDGNAPHNIRQMQAAGFPFEEDMLTAPHATKDDNFEEF